MPDTSYSSPSRRVCQVPFRDEWSTIANHIKQQAKKKPISYVESGGEEDDEEEAFVPKQSNKPRGRLQKRRRIQVESESDVGFGDENQAESVDEGMIYVAILLESRF